MYFLTLFFIFITLVTLMNGNRSHQKHHRQRFNLYPQSSFDTRGKARQQITNGPGSLRPLFDSVVQSINVQNIEAEHNSKNKNLQREILNEIKDIGNSQTVPTVVKAGSRGKQIKMKDMDIIIEPPPPRQKQVVVIEEEEPVVVQHAPVAVAQQAPPAVIQTSPAVAQAPPPVVQAPPPVVQAPLPVSPAVQQPVAPAVQPAPSLVQQPAPPLTQQPAAPLLVQQPPPPTVQPPPPSSLAQETEQRPQGPTATVPPAPAPVPGTNHGPPALPQDWETITIDAPNNDEEGEEEEEQEAEEEEEDDNDESGDDYEDDDGTDDDNVENDEQTDEDDEDDDKEQGDEDEEESRKEEQNNNDNSTSSKNEEDIQETTGNSQLDNDNASSDTTISTDNTNNTDDSDMNTDDSAGDDEGDATKHAIKAKQGSFNKQNPNANPGDGLIEETKLKPIVNKHKQTNKGNFADKLLPLKIANRQSAVKKKHRKTNATGKTHSMYNQGNVATFIRHKNIGKEISKAHKKISTSVRKLKNRLKKGNKNSRRKTLKVSKEADLGIDDAIQILRGHGYKNKDIKSHGRKHDKKHKKIKLK